MRHGVDGRYFGRNTSHRKAMFMNLANALLTHDRITTTLHKAKELRRVADRLVTVGKKDSVHARRQAFAQLGNRDAVVRLFNEIAPRYKTRNGGYTRIIRLGETRLGDAAKMAIIEFVDSPAKVAPSKKEAAKKEKAPKKAAKEEKAADKKEAPAKKAPAKKEAAPKKAATKKAAAAEGTEKKEPAKRGRKPKAEKAE